MSRNNTGGNSFIYFHLLSHPRGLAGRHVQVSSPGLHSDSWPPSSTKAFFPGVGLSAVLSLPLSRVPSRKNFSRVQICVTLRTVACQAPLSMGFSRQEYWSAVPYLPPGDLPDPGIKPKSLTSPALAGRFFTLSTTWEAPFSMLYSPFPSAESLLKETLVPQVGDLLQEHTLPYIVKVTIYSLDTVHLTDMPALNNTSGFCRLFLGPHTLLSPFRCPHTTTCV